MAENNQIANERTALLSATENVSSSRGTDFHPETFTDDESDEEISANEFDNIVARSETISTGLGIEVESQETSMLRGPRRRSSATNFRRRASQASRKKSFSTLGSYQDIPE